MTDARDGDDAPDETTDGPAETTDGPAETTGERASTSVSPRDDPGTATAGFVVEQPIRPGETDAVRELVAEASSRRTGVAEILPADAVPTASLFVRHGAGGDALVWYLEVETGAADRSAAPADPRATVRESPLFDAGLGDSLDGSGVRTFADDTVHATHPDRAEMPPGEDVVLVRLAIRPGFGERFVGLLARAMDWLEGGRIERYFEESSEEVLEDEGMLTETLFLDREDGRSLLWYMEAEDMEQVVDAYYDTANPVARASEVVLGAVLDRPDVLLGDPMDDDEYKLLVHAVRSERP